MQRRSAILEGGKPKREAPQDTASKEAEVETSPQKKLRKSKSSKDANDALLDTPKRQPMDAKKAVQKANALAARKPADVIMPQSASDDLVPSTKWFLINIIGAGREWRSLLQGTRLAIGADSARLRGHNSEGKDMADYGAIVETEKTPMLNLLLAPEPKSPSSLRVRARVHGTIKIGKELPATAPSTEKEQTVKLDAIAQNNNELVPVAAWKGCNAPTDKVLKGFTADAIDACGDGTASKVGFIGRFNQGPKLELIGTPRRASQQGGAWVLGAVQQGSKVMSLYDPHIMDTVRNVEFGRDRIQELAREKEERGKADLRSQRAEAINTSGAAKKIRQENSKAQRVVNEDKVADMQACLDELNQRTANFSSMDSIKENDISKMREELLPKFDSQTSVPSKIYEEGLATMINQRTLKDSLKLQNREVESDLKDPTCLIGAEASALQERFGTVFAAHVAITGANHADIIKTEPEIASRRLMLMNILMKLYKLKRPRMNRLMLEEQLDISPGDNNPNAAPNYLLHNLWNNFLQENPGQKNVRHVYREKILIHIAVIALDVAGYKLDFAPLAQELTITPKELELKLRYIGCEVNKKVVDMRVHLETALKAPLKFQALSKGSGRGRKRS